MRANYQAKARLPIPRNGHCFLLLSVHAPFCAPSLSYGDVLDSAKGWAASLRFSPSLLQQLNDFYRRPDTFSLGVCNGCQLMALLGWVREGTEWGHTMAQHSGQALDSLRGTMHEKQKHYSCAV